MTNNLWPELTDEQKAYATASTVCEDTHTGDANYYATNLVLKSNIQLMFAFSNVTTDMNAVVTYTNHWGTARTVTIDGSDFTVNGSYYVVTVDTLAVADARQDVTCTIYDGDTVVSTATDSVESYVARRSTGGDLFEYLMKFADSAYAYFHANESTATYSVRSGQVDEGENTGWVSFGAGETTEETASAYSLATASEEVCPSNRTLVSTTTVEYEYVYASGKLIRETIDDTSTEGTDVVMDFFYDANGNPYAMEHNGYMLYYILNPQGDVQYLVDSSGSPYVTYTYDEWGNPLLISNDSAVGKNNPLRYRGYVYDTELEMYYLQSRYYDPAIGRFINADSYASTGQGFVGYNMFAYCGNNPVCRIDYSGNSFLPIPGLLDYCGMHKAVQYDIAEQYGYGIEVYVRGSLGIGFLDLYDGITNSYYEVKHIGADSGKLFDNQIAKYDAASVTGWRFKEYNISGKLSKGMELISGWTTYLYWDIRYWRTKPGVIVYREYINESRYKQHLSITAVALGAGIIAYASGHAKGGLAQRPERTNFQ